MIALPSPNQNDRPPGQKPNLIVVHGTNGTDEGDKSWLVNPEAEVSYHVLVTRDGSKYRLVPDRKRAWHAGVSSWQGRDDANDFSLGVGISCKKNEAYTAAAIDAAADVVANWMHLWRIPFAGIVGHENISSPRKTDPWDQFHWGGFFGLVLAYYAILTGQRE